MMYSDMVVFRTWRWREFFPLSCFERFSAFEGANKRFSEVHSPPQNNKIEERGCHTTEKTTKKYEQRAGKPADDVLLITENTILYIYIIK